MFLFYNETEATVARYGRTKEKETREMEMTRSSEEKRMSDKCQGVADEEIGPPMSGF